MDKLIPAAHLSCPNKLGRYYLIALQEVLRRSGYTALLNWVGLPQYAETLPPDDWKRAFDFSVFARCDSGLVERYGPRGGRRLALRSGQRFFERGVKELAPLSRISELALRPFPVQTKLKLGLNALARLFSRTSDQGTRVEEQTAHFLYEVTPCPICWGRTAQEPTCFFTAGMLQEATIWLSGGQTFTVREALCIASGNEQCVFEISKKPLE